MADTIMATSDKVLDRIFQSMPEDIGTVIACFHTGVDNPRYLDPMPRHPQPDTGQIFGVNFFEIYNDAVETNAAAHDGAILFHRDSVDESYMLASWSQRIIAPAFNGLKVPNRGSAFHSALALSAAGNYDAIYLCSGGGVERMQNGISSRLR